MSSISPEEEQVNLRFLEAYNKLKSQRKVKGKTDFLNSLGLPREYFSRIEQNKISLPDSGIKNLSHIYHISEDWLLKNIGDMFSGPLKEHSKGDYKRIEEQSVPLFDFEAAAGLTKLFSNSENVIDYIKIPNLPKCDGAVHISGDSMYPLLKSGDIVMYKQIHDIANGILFGEMYLLSAVIGGEDLTLVKFIKKSEMGPDYVKLVSQNQHHGDKDIHISDIRALGYIKASIRINSMA